MEPHDMRWVRLLIPSTHQYEALVTDALPLPLSPFHQVVWDALQQCSHWPRWTELSQVAKFNGWRDLKDPAWKKEQATGLVVHALYEYLLLHALWVDQVSQRPTYVSGNGIRGAKQLQAAWGFSFEFPWVPHYTADMERSARVEASILDAQQGPRRGTWEVLIPYWGRAVSNLTWAAPQERVALLHHHRVQGLREAQRAARYLCAWWMCGVWDRAQADNRLVQLVEQLAHRGTE